MQITHASASAAILRAADENRLVQGQWHTTGERGRHMACLLGSIAPSVNSAADCNGDLMPLWMAELTVTLFDGMPTDQIVPIAYRYGGLVARWHTLTEAQWHGVLMRFLIRCIDDAVEAARPLNVGKPYWPAVEAACKQSKSAVLSGDDARAGAAARAAWAAAEAAEAAARAAQYHSLFAFLLAQIESECR